MPDEEDSTKLTWWLIGALFTVILLVVGFHVTLINTRFNLIEAEQVRLRADVEAEKLNRRQVAAERGERITKIEGNVENLILRLSSLDSQVFRLREDLNRLLWGKRPMTPNGFGE